jgi:prophage regulatory protein
MTEYEQTDRIVREAECLAITGASRTTRWRWERAGIFPARVQTGPNSVGWRLSALTAWMNEISNCRGKAA